MTTSLLLLLGVFQLVVVAEGREKKGALLSNFQGLAKCRYDQRVAFPRTEEELKRILLETGCRSNPRGELGRALVEREVLVRENHRRGRGRGKEREYFYERGESGRGGTKTRARVR